MINRKGSILIFALWTISFLAIFTVHIGMRTRQRIHVLSTIENNNRISHLAAAGIKKGIAALRYDIARSNGSYSVEAKMYRHNNPEKFKGIELGYGHFDVRYKDFPNSFEQAVPMYGFVDEERKININVADRDTISKLLEIVFGWAPSECDAVAGAVIVWRELSDTQEAASLNDYYMSLKNPYPNKGAPFENPMELLQVRGFSKPIYDQLEPFITVYGDGLLNINTASRVVLMALGLDGPAADKLLEARRGYDQIENTEDDHIFKTTANVTSDVQSIVDLDNDEVIMIEFLNGGKKIKTNSDYYRFESVGQMDGKQRTREISCVYNAKDNIIPFWREK